MQRHPMDKLPGVFPALVRLGQIATISERVPLPGALNEPSHGIAAKFFGKDPPLSDDAAGGGAHGEGGAEFGEEAGLVVDLGGFCIVLMMMSEEGKGSDRTYVDFVAVPAETDGRCQAAYSGADDDDF
jgi:hypothetical protein